MRYLTALNQFILEFKYTDKDLEEIASKYTSRKDFRNDAPQAYSAASKRGKDFYSKIVSHMDRLRRKPYTDEELKDIASKYTNIKDFEENDDGAFQAIKNRGKDFYNSVMSHINRLTRKPYTDKELKDIASKYTTIKDLKDNSRGAFQAIKNRGKDFYISVTSHMSRYGKQNYVYHKYTDEELKNIASKYITIKDFKENDYGAYRAALNRGEDFYSSIMSHTNRLRRTYTDEELEQIANKYDYKIDFFEKDNSAWAASRRRGKDFYKKVTSHMDNKIRNNGFSNKEVEDLIDYLDKGESINNICKYMSMPYIRIVNKIHDLYRLDKLPANARKNFELLNKKGEGKQIVLHRFTEKDIKKIIKLYNEGKSSKQISELTHHSRIGMVINLFKEAKELKNSRFSEDYKKEEIEDIISDNFNLNVFCEKWKRGHYEASIKRRQLLNKKDETKSYSIYTGSRLIKLIKSIAKTIKKEYEYDEVPKKHYVQSELYKSLKGINCSILTLLGPTPNRFVSMLQEYDIIGNNDIYAYEKDPNAVISASNFINIDKDNIHLTYGNIYKSLPQRLIDLDLTQQWETQGESIKKLFNRQKENINGNKYFMFTLSLRGKENSEIANYIKEIIEDILSIKIDVNVKSENVLFEANDKKMTVIKYNITGIDYKIIAYKYADTSTMISILINYK